MFSMPDLSDVGPPATGPGLPQRKPEALPPTVKIHVVHRYLSRPHINSYEVSAPIGA